MYDVRILESGVTTKNYRGIALVPPTTRKRAEQIALSAAGLVSGGDEVVIMRVGVDKPIRASEFSEA